jgi:hypothetical protein
MGRKGTGGKICGFAASGSRKSSLITSAAPAAAATATDAADCEGGNQGTGDPRSRPCHSHQAGRGGP